MSTIDPESSGRIVFDERGNPVWEWRTESGSFSRDGDTQRVKALQEKAAKALGQTQGPPPGYDPYSAHDVRSAPPEMRRRTLDDMRKLSEEIKRAQERKKSRS